VLVLVLAVDVAAVGEEAVVVADLAVAAVAQTRVFPPTPIAKPVDLVCVSFTAVFGDLHQARSSLKTKFVA